MEETPFVQIQCPDCKACYRIDKAKIPDNGSMVTCRNCQSKFAVRKHEPPRAESPRAESPRAESPRAESPRAESPRAEPPKAEPPKAEPPEAAQAESVPVPPSADGKNIVCPKCGFKQIHPFRCYKCGFAFQGQNNIKQNTVNQDMVNQNTANQNVVRQNTAQQSPIGPTPQMATPKPPEAARNSDSGEAEVIVKARFLPLMILLFLFKPRIEIDGRTHERSWGTHRFKVKSGRHKISVYFPYFFITRCGENWIDISLKANETAYIEYNFQVPLIFLKGSIRKIPSQTGLVPFTPEGPSASAFHGWYTTPAAVIILLILLWPVGLFLLWVSDEFSKQTKWVLTGIIVFIAIMATMSP